MVQSSGEVIALTTVFTFLELLFVFLRVYARRVKRITLAIDDVLIILAAISFVLCLTIPLIIQCVDANLGNHVQRTPNGKPVRPTQLYRVLERVTETTHVLPITLAKCSILFLYKRIFRGPVFLAIVWTTLSLVLIWGFSFFFSLLFLCTPLEIYMRYGSSAPGVSCTNEVQVYYSLSISDCLIDFIILIIPIPFVWRLQMPPKQKIAVTAVFLLGCLTIAASITRMVTFVNAANLLPQQSVDYSYYAAQSSYWTVIETSLAITSACLPAIRPLFQGFSSKPFIHSFRSAIALRSSRDAHSNHNNHRSIHSVQNFKEPSSSTVRLHEMLAPNHELAVTTNGITLHDMPEVPTLGEEGVRKQRSFV